ncbi:MAG: type II toxin-antitoxin system VapB family antitoxin [Planctomycetota bacterium]
MKRTNVVLDEELVAEAKKATGIKTTRELVDTALRELLRQKDIRKILELRGQVEWEGDLSEMRRLRTFE